MKKNNGSRQESCWMLQTKRADFGTLAKRFHISPVTARIIRNRGIVLTATPNKVAICNG